MNVRLTQIPITRYPPATAHEVENRYRCIEARHEGRLFSPWMGGTFCLCGRAVWEGDRSLEPTPYERAESDSTRPDEVGRRARAYLDEVHGCSSASGMDRAG